MEQDKNFQGAEEIFPRDLVRSMHNFKGARRGAQTPLGVGLFDVGHFRRYRCSGRSYFLIIFLTAMYKL